MYIFLTKSQVLHLFLTKGSVMYIFLDKGQVMYLSLTKGCVMAGGKFDININNNNPLAPPHTIKNTPLHRQNRGLGATYIIRTPQKQTPLHRQNPWAKGYVHRRRQRRASGLMRTPN